MKTHTIAAAAITIAGLAAASLARAGGDRVAFPENYAKGVRYLTLDKPDSRDVHDFYTSPGAAEAAKKGAPLPDGTVITVVLYAAQLDAEGKPTRDSWLRSDGEARRMGRRLSGSGAQRRLGVSGLPSRQDGQSECQFDLLFHLP
jgi:hypothetical protein